MHTRFLLCSNKSFCLFLHLPCGKCNIGCDTSTGHSAGQRPASIQPRHNTSILRCLTLPTFCAQRSQLSLRCGPFRSYDSQTNVNTDISAQQHSLRSDCLQGLFDPAALEAPLFTLHPQTETPSECVCHQGLVIRGDRHSVVKRLCDDATDSGIFFLPTPNLVLELINLSVLLDYTRDECGYGLDLLSKGGLSLKDGIYLD